MSSGLNAKEHLRRMNEDPRRVTSSPDLHLSKNISMGNKSPSMKRSCTTEDLGIDSIVHKVSLEHIALSTMDGKKHPSKSTQMTIEVPTNQSPKNLNLKQEGEKYVDVPSIMISSPFTKAKLRIKKLVSKKKRRFEQGKYNLDLTYITPRIIAMGYPSEKVEGIYRNHYRDVYDLFEARHQDRYRMYNLCAERSYDIQKFHGRVGLFPFQDHNPPTLETMIAFCQDADEWLRRNSENVISIHCKAGKGRTGVMACAYFLYSKRWITAEGAIKYYGAARSTDDKGITIPSQKRFVHYFAQLCQGFGAANGHNVKEIDEEAAQLEKPMSREEMIRLWEDGAGGRVFGCDYTKVNPSQPILPPVVRLNLISITLHDVKGSKFNAIYGGITSHGPTGGDYHTDKEGGRKSEATLYDISEKGCSFVHKGVEQDGQFRKQEDIVIEFKQQWIVSNEVKVLLMLRGTRFGSFWFHTAFIDKDKLELSLQKHEIDKIRKNSKHTRKLIGPSFHITLAFRDPLQCTM